MSENGAWGATPWLARADAASAAGPGSLDAPARARVAVVTEDPIDAEIARLEAQLAERS